jgi:hypothetical protein
VKKEKERENLDEELNPFEETKVLDLEKKDDKVNERDSVKLFERLILPVFVIVNDLDNFPELLNLEERENGVLLRNLELIVKALEIVTDLDLENLLD